MRVLLLFAGWFAFATLGLAKIQVVTTHTVVTDFVSVVGGDQVEARCLVPVSLDPHSYEPKPADIRLLSRADLVVTNGLGLEPWAEKVIAQSGYRGPVIHAATGLPRLLRLDQEDEHAHDTYSHEHYDPHAWHNPKNAGQYVAAICEALIQVAPAQADTFRQNAAKYTAQLNALDEFAREQFAQLSVDQRKLVTAHDALRYLADAYGLTIIPIAGTRPDQEPSARQLAQLVNFIRQQHVAAVFFETTTNPKLAELVANEAGVKVVGELYTDNLGALGTPGATYLGMFRANVETITRALR